MVFLEIRRHSVRVPPDNHLSPMGKRLARRVGQSIGPCRRVITSPLPRAVETAQEMGFHIDEKLDLLGVMNYAAESELHIAATYQSVARVLQQGGPAAGYAEALADCWRGILESIPAGEQALIVTHQYIIEAGTVACLPNLDYSKWGKLTGYCEGVRLGYENGQFTRAEPLRVNPYDE